MTTILDVEQGTQEWLDARKNRIGGSDAPSIMGVGYHTARKIGMQKLGLLPASYTSQAMQRGKDLEPLALLEFKRMTGYSSMTPKVLVPQGKDWLIASMDGIDLESKIAVEIKCPTNMSTHCDALNGKVPERYVPQLQHQMNVCGLDMIYYFSFDGSSGTIIEVERDDHYILDLEEKEFAFWEALQNLEIPDAVDRDLPVINDEYKLDLIQKLLGARGIGQQAKKDEEMYRKELIELQGGLEGRGGGIMITKQLCKGLVDYSLIPELRGLDLNQYRNPRYEKWVFAKEKK